MTLAFYSAYDNIRCMSREKTIWEYNIHPAHYGEPDSPKARERLNKSFNVLGSAGWEIFHVSHREDSYMIYMKRKKEVIPNA